MPIQVLFWAVVAFVGGIVIGSFLNAVIYRLPNNLSLLEPKTSICPNCREPLGPIDLIPLVSFLALGRKCRQCKVPISWRYFNVELLTGALFVALYLHFAQPHDAPNCIAILLFTAVLIPVFFIDLATFTIPDSLNILLFLIPLGRDLWGIARHEPGHNLLWGWLPPSILGAVAGILVFGAVRVAGWIWKRQEAMGLGDVLLARGMGAMLVSVVPPEIAANGPANLLRLFPIWVLLACFSGIIVGPLLIFLRLRNAAAAPAPTSVSPASSGQGDGSGPPASGGQTGDEDTLLKQLAAIAYCLILADFYVYIRHYIAVWRNEPMEAEPEDDWTPAPTAIPFGPFLVIGFLATVFCGEALTAMYLAYALPKQTEAPPQ